MYMQLGVSERMAEQNTGGDYSDVVSRREFVSLAGATGAAAVAGCLDGGDDGGDTGQGTVADNADVYFDTAQMEHTVDSYHYNYNEWAGTTHAEFGLFSQYTVYDWQNGEFHGHLVEEWEVGDTEMTLSLRDDITWETGEPVDAESLKVQWDAYEQGGHALFDFADSVEATGDFELTVTYPENTNTGIIEHAILHESANMAPADWEDFSGESLIDHDVPEPTASGPLTLDDTDENYHQFAPRDDDHPFAGNYNWNGYRMRYRENNQAAHQSFRNQELDGIHSLFANDAVLQRFPDTIEEINIPGVFGMGMWFNHNREPWNNRQVRQAVASSLDLESVLLNLGQDKKLYHQTQTGLTQAAAEQWLGGTEDIEGFNAYEQAGSEEVASMVEEAGYDINEITMDFVVPAGWSDWIQMAGQIGDQLGLAGWDVNVNTVGGAYWSIRPNGEYDVIAGPHKDSPQHNHPYFGLRFQLYGESGTPAAWSNYASPDDGATVELDGETIDVQSTFEELATTADESTQEDLVRTLARIVNVDVPYIHVAQKYEQSFIDREKWAFPDEHLYLRTQWPMWMLPKTDEELESWDAGSPGLLKAKEAAQE